VTQLEAERNQLAGECQKLETLYEGVLRGMQEEQEKATRESSELRETIATLKQEMETATRHGMD